ncbi:M1 family metallopeptidase [Thermanaeromonas toyohensis]|uniref:M1 family metallopeptidase n=1 Tax=Thermanaeromonas toyohensis TaxID=161154 RepID=UPI000A029DFA|nr:M1 family metallopeptidase [Thermanaeromonas toyohensis]
MRHVRTAAAVLMAVLTGYACLGFYEQPVHIGGGTPRVSLADTVLSPPPVRKGGRVFVPVEAVLLAQEGGKWEQKAFACVGSYIPLGQALDLLEIFSVEEGRDGMRVPAWGADPAGRSHYRIYPLYDVVAHVDAVEGVIKGNVTVSYRNPYFSRLSDLQFLLPGNGFAWGGSLIKVDGVRVDGRQVEFAVVGSRLEVPLPRPVAPLEAVSVGITFTTRLPRRPGRLGIFDGIIVASGWYPLLCPRQGGIWVGMAEGAAFGDPYFSDAGYYRAAVEVPAGLAVVASGKVSGRREGNGRTVWFFTSEKPVREFTFVAGTGWKMSTGCVGHTEVMLASRRDADLPVLAGAVPAFSFFSDYWGPYPYTYLHVVVAPLEDGLWGMEYPGLVLVNARKGIIPHLVVVHEVAHQWWYNLVGNDTIRSAWIDEGLAEYSALVYCREKGPELYGEIRARVTAGGKVPEREKDLRLYGTEEEYRQAVYGGGALYWLEREEVMGTGRLREALRWVQEYYRYDRVDAGDLERILAFFDVNGSQAPNRQKTAGGAE